MDGSWIVNRLAGFGVLRSVGTDDINAHRSGKAQIERPGFRVLSPDLNGNVCQRPLEVQSVAVDCDLDVADGVSAGQVADGIPGQEQDHLGFAAPLRAGASARSAGRLKAGFPKGRCSQAFSSRFRERSLLPSA